MAVVFMAVIYRNVLWRGGPHFVSRHTDEKKYIYFCFIGFVNEEVMWSSSLSSVNAYRATGGRPPTKIR